MYLIVEWDGFSRVNCSLVVLLLSRTQLLRVQFYCSSFLANFSPLDFLFETGQLLLNVGVCVINGFEVLLCDFIMIGLFKSKSFKSALKWWDSVNDRLFVRCHCWLERLHFWLYSRKLLTQPFIIRSLSSIQGLEGYKDLLQTHLYLISAMSLNLLRLSLKFRKSSNFLLPF